MLKGIDISKWDYGIDLQKCDIDFCICKLSEGIAYKDKCFDEYKRKIDECNIPFGFYHFARENNPHDEARWFYEYSKSFYMNGVPILDYETSNDNDVYWCEQFMNEYHNLTGKWCTLYISAYRCRDYADSWIKDCCKLWVAGYPQEYTQWIEDCPPYNLYPWKDADIWQFTSTLKISNYQTVDADLCYTDIFKFQNTSDIDDVVFDVIKGRYGNGTNRIKSIEVAGYDYNEVQRRVNEYYIMANRVINGDYGNGDERKEKLALTGYRYNITQYIVNEFLT